MNYEQKIKEARTIEAMRKGYMGMGGKFCLIAKKLGSSIVRQGGVYADSTEIDDPFKEFDLEEIETMEIDEPTTEVGLQFDGLSRGMNISILIMHHLAEIKVIWEGRTVFKEVSGELEGYNPQKDWEDIIDKLYNMAKRVQNINKPIEKELIKEQNEKQKNKLIQQLKDKWGV
jgi:hypothetical protein